jgi:hypothetical protein
MKFQLSLIFLFLLFASCHKQQIENKSTLVALHKIYVNGEITACTYEGARVYQCALNGYDLGSKIYDQDGKLIGTCSIWKAPADQICNTLEECEVIYRISENVWNLPGIDKYGLGN